MIDTRNANERRHVLGSGRHLHGTWLEFPQLIPTGRESRGARRGRDEMREESEEESMLI